MTVDIIIFFALCVLCKALHKAHNHPSGTLKPSEPDRRLTQKINNAADFFKIKILDHIIISPDGNYFIFADNGIL
ncbi:JAB domain-containing protein [Salegentibacter salinarum]|uniref:JAB domain-containing protein n=1 Tax=Salegentibacter salinarum TaxID=447422 RepID=UPI0009A860BE|nr:JAB domain-containing protein [Salegentibacter salinarum]